MKDWVGFAFVFSRDESVEWCEYCSGAFGGTHTQACSTPLFLHIIFWKSQPTWRLFKVLVAAREGCWTTLGDRRFECLCENDQQVVHHIKLKAIITSFSPLISIHPNCHVVLSLASQFADEAKSRYDLSMTCSKWLCGQLRGICVRVTCRETHTAFLHYYLIVAITQSILILSEWTCSVCLNIHMGTFQRPQLIGSSASTHLSEALWIELIVVPITIMECSQWMCLKRPPSIHLVEDVFLPLDKTKQTRSLSENLFEKCYTAYFG